MGINRKQIIDKVCEGIDFDHMECPKCGGTGLIVDKTRCLPAGWEPKRPCNLCKGMETVDYNTYMQYTCLGYKKQ